MLPAIYRIGDVVERPKEQHSSNARCGRSSRKVLHLGSDRRQKFGSHALLDDTAKTRTESRHMCNLDSVTTTRGAVRRFFRVDCDLAGDLPPLAELYPAQVGPVARNGEDGA